MITVIYDATGGTLTAQGHADYAPKGRDIVCAAISAIMYTADAALRSAYREGKLPKPHNKSESDGEMRLAWVRSDYADDLVDKIADGLFAVAAQYPQYVRCKKIL